ncbi:MAG: hypothetical protein RBR63_01630 [Methanosarcina vacuolata]|nr:hypothetical protein [Methanosarcina vacuolata]
MHNNPKKPYTQGKTEGVGLPRQSLDYKCPRAEKNYQMTQERNSGKDLQKGDCPRAV